MKTQKFIFRIFSSLFIAASGLLGFGLGHVFAQTDNPNPPEEPVKLVFIHHSTGENWLQDGYGDLGIALDQNNYFVSDTNYGWGPGNIGDNTDIVNWPEWFGPERSERVLNRLFEESGQNSGWTRTLNDPGGENEIILFKSCFPNSELSGSPNDPPTPGEYDYTVGSAKYIYNLLLEYFLTRPDKMFVVITAPPVSGYEYAANARAFNNWLVYDWLADYPGSNVFVFDFYNVLTGADAHHRFRDGQIEHVVVPGMDTLYYPSDDDHPSAAGSQKATMEFIPLLNIFYHRWKSSQPYQPPEMQQPEGEELVQQEEPEEAPVEAPPAELQVEEGGLVTSFEDEASGWESHDDGMGSSMNCTADDEQSYAGAYSLRMTFDLIRDGYAGCGIYFEEPQDWSQSQGLSILIRAQDPDIGFTLIIASGPGDQATPFEAYIQAPPACDTGWKQVYLPWSELTLASWVEDTGEVFDPGRVVGIEFSVGAGEERLENTVWVDDLRLGQEAAQPGVVADLEIEEEPMAEAPEEETFEDEEDIGSRIGRLCPVSLALPLVVVSLALRRRRL